MRNRKGFTLVEVLVSIGLLALLGLVIAISLNRVFKDNNKKNYLILLNIVYKIYLVFLCYQ